MVVVLQYAFVQSYSVSNSPTLTAKHVRSTVSVFVRTLELTALLLKKIHLLLRCVSLLNVLVGLTFQNFFFPALASSRQRENNGERRCGAS